MVLRLSESRIRTGSVSVAQRLGIGDEDGSVGACWYDVGSSSAVAASDDDIGTAVGSFSGGGGKTSLGIACFNGKSK